MDTLKSQLLGLLQKNDLLRASLLVGKVENPAFDSELYIEKLLSVASQAWFQSRYIREDVIDRIHTINEVLFKQFKLLGKTEKYKPVIDDPTRYFIHEVLDKKQGSPLSVTLIYTIMLEQLGIHYEVYALPQYYYLKIPDITGDFYLDPFDSGKLVKPEEFQKKFKSVLQKNRMISTNLFEKVTPQHLIGRLIQQIKHIFILKSDALLALRSVELLSVIFPESPEITRDRGILYCEMEYFSKAIEDLRFYLKKRPNAEDVQEIKKLTTMLKGYREVMN